MALDFITNDPSALLAAFKQRINQTEETGKIKTWVQDQGGFTHVASNWYRLAWFQSEIRPDRLRFKIVNPTGKIVAVTTYGYYHGHLNETFLNHFDRMFSWAYTSALGTGGDMLAPPKG